MFTYSQMIKQFYFSQFNLASVNKVKQFQVLLCISNNSIKHQSFVYTQLNHQTVLFQIIQFSISIQFKYQTVQFDLEIGPYQVLPLWTKVDLVVMAMKWYSAFLKAPALLEPHHQIF